MTPASQVWGAIMGHLAERRRAVLVTDGLTMTTARRFGGGKTSSEVVSLMCPPQNLSRIQRRLADEDYREGLPSPRCHLFQMMEIALLSPSQPVTKHPKDHCCDEQYVSVNRTAEFFWTQMICPVKDGND